MLSQNHTTFLQFALLICCPHIRTVCICIHNKIIIQPDTYFIVILSFIRFNINMLAKHQTVRGIQIHIERICTGRSLIIAGTGHSIHCHIRTVITCGIIHIHRTHGSLPCLGRINSGADNYRRSLYDGIPVHLIYRSFHAIGSRT